jgi:hypothetical protein
MSDASTPDKDSLVGLQKMAALNSNTATRHILDASNYLTKNTAQALSYRIADILKFSELKEIDISNDTQKEIDLSQEKPQVDFNKGTKVDTRNYQTWIPGYFQYKNSNWADTSLYWITIPSLAYIGYTEKIRGDQIAKDPWNDPVNLFFLLQNRSPLEIYYFRNRREEQKSKYADAQVNQKYIASGLLLFYAFHWVDLYFFDGEGIIKSFSSSHREQANLGIDHITGVEFQWRFDTSQ